MKCRTIKRLVENERWDSRLVHEMEGTTWQPVPGSKSDHVPVEIDNQGKPSARADEDDDAVDYHPVPLEEDVGAAGRNARSSKNTDIRVTHNDLERYGTMLGCALPSRFGVLPVTK